jgi:hypothetical protein
MATLADVRSRKPASTMIIPVSAFSDDWEHRPTAAIAVGLRLLSEQQAQQATREAARTTVEFLHLDDPAAKRPSAEVENEVYTSRIMGFAIAHAVCDPNDVLEMHKDLPAMEDHVFRYFSPAGIKFVFEALQAASAKVSPVSPVADDEDLALLIAHIRVGTIAALPRAEQLAVLRLLACALEPLRVKAPGVVPDVADGESDHEAAEDGESDYSIRVTA